MTDPLIILLAVTGVAILLGLLALAWRVLGLRRALLEARTIPLAGACVVHDGDLDLRLHPTEHSTVTIERLSMPRPVATAFGIAPPDGWRIAEDHEDPLEPPDTETAAAAAAFHDAWISWVPAAQPPTLPLSLRCRAQRSIPDGTPMQILWSVRARGITRRGGITLHTGSR